MFREIRPLAIGLAAALAWTGAVGAVPINDGPRKGADERLSSPDPITSALDDRIQGKAGLGDVQVDVYWSRDGRATTARIFGDGVGIWQREAQFELSKARVLDILTVIQKARFGSMPDRFGEDEDGEKNEGPRLKGRLVVRAGTARKSTLQLVDGEQSEAFSRLVEKILEICRGPARRGIGAESMSDALGLLAAGRLSAQVLEAAFQRRPDPKSRGGSEQGWTLRLAGLHVTGEQIDPGKPKSPARALGLSPAEFRELAALLSEADPSALPQSLYAASYTDFTIEIFKYSRTITGRRFLGMTPETHGKKQKAFDRICAAFEALHARVEKGGAP
jgi:hypothetical protein